jgi:quinol monooxygenase YgiN
VTSTFDGAFTERRALMIIVRITMEALMESRKEMMQTLLSMIEPAAKEKGCLSYDVFCDLEGNHVFNLIEEWETREDLDHHIRSERFSVLLGTKSLLAKPLEMNIHTVSHSEGVEVVNTLRDKGTSKKNFKRKERMYDMG